MTTGVTTLKTVRDAARSQCDMVGSTFVTDAEFNSFIQDGYQELYGLVVQKFGNDYFTQTPASGYTFTTDGVNQFFALPDGSGASPAFFKLLGVDLQFNGSQWVALKEFAFADRNRLQLVNSSIPMAGQTLRLFYVPRLTLPTADGSTMDGVNGWEAYIVAHACIKALTKEESDAAPFVQQKRELLERIESEAENRDAGSPATVADVTRRRALGMRYRLNGNQIWLIGNGQPGWEPFGDWGDYA